jgi:hypothetical protein
MLSDPPMNTGQMWSLVIFAGMRQQATQWPPNSATSACHSSGVWVPLRRADRMRFARFSLLLNRLRMQSPLH